MNLFQLAPLQMKPASSDSHHTVERKKFSTLPHSKKFKKKTKRKKNIYIYIYIYIYCHPQTDCFILSELFGVARHAGRSKRGSKPAQLYVRLSLRPLGHQADHVG